MLASATRLCEEAMAAAMAGPLGGAAQELVVVCVFLVSWVTWHRLGQQQRAQLQHMRAAKKLADPSTKRQSHGGRGYSACHGQESKTCIARSEGRKVEGGPSQSTRSTAEEAEILEHLEKREFTRALNLYRAIERDGRRRDFSEGFYLAFIQSAVRVGMIDVVERLLRAMKRSSMVPSVAFWQTTLRMLASRKHFTSCLSARTIFDSQLPADKVVFSCLINAALELDVPELAATMLDRYAETDLDVRDHVLFFRTFAAMKNAPAAEAMLRKLGAQATTLMLNLSLLTCVSADQLEHAWEILQCAYEFRKAMLDVVSYNTVIKGFAQSGNSGRCFECLQEMLDRGLEPDDITFTTLLDAGIEEADVGAIGRVVNLVIESNRPLGTVMCTLFIKALIKANCLPKALELCKEMRERAGAGPDIITYSVLIKALVDLGDLEQAMALFEDMRCIGLAADDIIFTHLLEGCRHRGDYVLGKRLFKEMLACGTKPSAYMLVTMLKLLGRVGAHQEAHRLVAGWKAAHGQRPSIIHYTCLMSGCLRSKSYDLAWAAYELMSSNGVKPDDMALSTLLPGMVAAQQWDKVMVLARTALEGLSQQHQKQSLPSEALNSALSQMQGAGGLDRHVEQLGDLMTEAGIPISARSGRRRLVR